MLSNINEDWNIGDSDDEGGIVDQITVPENLEPEHVNTKNGRETLLLFGAKRFLVHHDYILFPYCVGNEGELERPVLSRVSRIIKTNKSDRYLQISQDLDRLAELIDVDTSYNTNLHTLREQIEQCRQPTTFESLPGYYKEFINSVRKLLIERKNYQDYESYYRSTCVTFLKMLLGSLSKYHVQEVPDKRTHDVTLHRCSGHVNLPVTAQPSSVITQIPYEFQNLVTVVVKCHRYREMNMQVDEPVLPDDEADIKQIKPKVTFSDDASPKGKVLMFNNLDAKICRPLKVQEKEYFGLFIAQSLVEMLAWFEPSSADRTLEGLLPLGTMTTKTVRHGIGVIGFKIVFLSLGMNSNSAMSPHITVGGESASGLDLFMTRPFDMMLAADRAIIKDIMFALTS